MLFPSSSQPNSPRCWSRRQANPSSCRQRRPQEAQRTQTQTPPFWQSQAGRQRSACPGCCPSASSHGGDGGDLSTEGGALSRSAPKHPAHKKPGSPPNINAEVSSDGAGQGFSRVSLPNHHSSHLDHIQPLPDLRDSTQSARTAPLAPPTTRSRNLPSDPRGDSPPGVSQRAAFPNHFLKTTGVALWVQFAVEVTPSGSARLHWPALTIATTGPELMYFTSRP